MQLRRREEELKPFSSYDIVMIYPIASLKLSQSSLVSKALLVPSTCMTHATNSVPRTGMDQNSSGQTPPHIGAQHIVLVLRGRQVLMTNDEGKQRAVLQSLLS